MNDELINTLQQYGMSDKQARVYLCVLQLWSAPASVISRRTDIKRVTVYAVLKDLEVDTVVSSYEKSGTTYFQAITPDILVARLRSKYEQFTAKLPELLALTNIYDNKPKIQYFEWVSWVKQMYEDLLSSDTEICAFLSIDPIDPRLRSYIFDDFLPRRIAAQITARVIMPTLDQETTYASTDKQFLKQTKFIDHAIFDMKWEINIYWPNKIAIALFTAEEMSAIIIESPHLYKSLTSIFNIVRSSI